MTTEDIINELKTTSNLSSETIEEIEDNENLRIEMVQYFSQYLNREFALNFLNLLIELRKKDDLGISGDSLMLACHILGKHKQVEDCLKVWEAKQVDFDTFCYIDIQLMPFQGVQETIKYLETQTSHEAQKALNYIIDCSKAGDFDNLEEYYSNKPWFV